MIALLRGSVVHHAIDSVVIDVAGVGYEVIVTPRTAAQAPVGQPATLVIHTHVREDAIVLYGFLTHHERALFLRLTTVTGVGPKLALHALQALGPEGLHRALVQGDEKVLTTIPGIGKRTAQRLIVDLADGIRALATPTGTAMPAPTGPEHDLLLALKDLGYPPAQIDRALLDIRPELDQGKSLDELLRAALRALR